MPIYVLDIKADIENIKKMTVLSDVLWKFDIANTSGEVKEGITFTSVDDIELQGSRGTCNVVVKWPGEKSQAYIKIIELKKCVGEYNEEQSGTFVPILAIECRGLEPTRWIPGRDFRVEGTTGTVFDNVDLGDPDGWTDFDEQNDACVSIMNLEHRIRRE
jgi:hypothetical protein